MLLLVSDLKLIAAKIEREADQPSWTLHLRSLSVQVACCQQLEAGVKTALKVLSPLSFDVLLTKSL